MSNQDTECHDAILSTLSRIPFGKVCSYGNIANISGHPGKARYVAYILKHLPDQSTIPWHRVINSQGKIAFPKDSSKYMAQQEKLLEEGVIVPLTKSLRDRHLWSGE